MLMSKPVYFERDGVLYVSPAGTWYVNPAHGVVGQWRKLGTQGPVWQEAIPQNQCTAS